MFHPEYLQPCLNREAAPRYYTTMVFPELVYYITFDDDRNVLEDIEVKGMARLAFLKDMEEAKSISGVVVYRSDNKVHEKRIVLPFIVTRQGAMERVLEDISLSFWKDSTCASKKS